MKQFKIEGKVSRLDCESCQGFVAVTVNDEVVNIDDKINGFIENGWKKVIRYNSIKS